MENKNIPEIRFAGFSGEWEQRKLGEITESYSGGTPSVGNKFYYGGNIPFIRSAEINSESTELFITEDGFNNSSAKMVKKGDILYALYGATSGEVGMSKIHGAINQAILAIKPKFGDNSYFITQWLKKQKNTIINTYLQGGQGNLSGSIVKDLIISLPNCKDEQVNIGEFFKQLDDTIALYQQELTILRQTKQGFLQKMFPKEGESVPEVRFPGFTGDWKQRELGEIVKLFSGLTYSPDNVIEDGGTFVLRSSNVKNGEIVDADNVYVKSDIVNSDNVQVGDVIVVVRNGSRDLIGKHAQIKKQMNDTVIGAFMTGIRSEIPNFTNAMLDTQQFSIEINKNLGATINQITTGAFKKMKFYIPTEKAECEQVGVFFANFDNLITLHQRELEALKETKKAFLQKMFV